MPIAGLPAPPSVPPPAGTKWVFYANQLLETDINSEGDIDTSVPGRETNFGLGNNGPSPSIPGAADMALARLYFAQWAMYHDHVRTGELMAVDWPVWPGPNSPGAMGFAKVDGGDFQVRIAGGGSPTYPLIWDTTWTCTVVPPDGKAVGACLTQVRGDLWVALPASSTLPQLNPSHPSLDPEQAGLELTWTRGDTRVPRTPIPFGAVAALTWPLMWDGAKRFLLDGMHLQVDTPAQGGTTVQADWYFIRIPGDPDTTVGPPSGVSNLPHTARVDTDLTDDFQAVTA